MQFRCESFCSKLFNLFKKLFNSVLYAHRLHIYAKLGAFMVAKKRCLDMTNRQTDMAKSITHIMVDFGVINNNDNTIIQYLARHRYIE